MAGAGGGEQIRIWQGMVAVFLFLLSLFAVSMSLNGFMKEWAGPDHLGVMDDKIDLFLTQKDEIDLIFMGTSRIYRNIDPLVFDSEMVSLGCPVRSFNFGVNLLTPVEGLYLLDRIRESQPKRLQWILFGQMSLPRYFDWNWGSHRMRFFNTWSNLPLAAKDLWQSPLATRERVVRLYRLLGSFLFEQLGIGRGSAYFFPMDNSKSGNGYRLTDTSHRGFLSTDSETHPSFAERHDKFLQRDLKSYRDKVLTRGRAHRDVDERSGAAQYKRLAPLLDRTREMAVEPGIVMVPSYVTHLTSRPLLATAAKENPNLPAWNFNQPDKWPELFDWSHFFDVGHLNRPGASLFSRLLAQEICPDMQARGR
ncbi:MAG: hypothetical protein HQL52_18650 [Magnetococcales bacterium]|nr:hypothetical protein [Magnetococcales bacterium]